MSKDSTPYEVLIDERVEKDLEKVPKHIVEKFLKQLDEFEKNPIRPRSGFDIKPMEGWTKEFLHITSKDKAVSKSHDHAQSLNSGEDTFIPISIPPFHSLCMCCPFS